MSVRKAEIVKLFHMNDVPFRMIKYAAPALTIEAVAAQQQVVREALVKSILLREKKRGRYVMACVLGTARLAPQVVRRHLAPNWRRLSFASAAEVQRVTGYLCGAVAPLCLPADMPIVFDTAIMNYTRVNIGCGDPSVGLELELRDLMRLTCPKVAPIVEAVPLDAQVANAGEITEPVDSTERILALAATE